MKSFLTFTLLIALTCSQICYGVIFVFEQLEAKDAMEEHILSRANDNELLAIPYNENQSKIVWTEEGKEFSLDGKMYDVVRCKYSNGEKIYYCIDDKNETKILDKYRTSADDNFAHGKKFKLNNVGQIIFFFSKKELLKPVTFVVKKTKFPIFNSPLSSPYTTRLLKPPRGFIA